jgi:hypothetical protein
MVSNAVPESRVGKKMHPRDMLPGEWGFNHANGLHCLRTNWGNIVDKDGVEWHAFGLPNVRKVEIIPNPFIFIPTPPAPDRVLDYIFEVVHARVEARENGKVIRKFATYNDWGGLEATFTEAIAEAKKWQAYYGKSSLEFVVVKIVALYRARPAIGEYLYDEQFVRLEALKWGSAHNLPEPREEVVWSSRSDRAESGTQADVDGTDD